MGRDDAKRVSGLQGGRAPAQAFAAFMRYAVKDRPIEEFDTEVQLPEWQLEPDEEFLYGTSDDYYFIDEQGNLIEPGQPRQPGQNGELPFAVEGEQVPGQTPSGAPLPGQAPPQGRAAPPAAVDENFLNEATGREGRDQPVLVPESEPTRQRGARVIEFPED